MRLNEIFECDDRGKNNIMKVIELTNNKILFCSKDFFAFDLTSNKIKKMNFLKKKKF